MTSFSIDSSNKMYYNVKDICEHHSELFKGIKTKKREIIERNKIPPSEYVHACFNIKFKCWNESNKECRKAHLLISKEWVDIHMLKITPVADIIAPILQVADIIAPSLVSDIIDPSPHIADMISSENKKQAEEPIIVDTPQIEYAEEESKEYQSEIENAPPILELEDEEKFHDTDGNILEIETRGERDVDKIFFRVRDVMKRFDMPNLKETLLKYDTTYERGLHYKTFNTVETIHRIKSFKSFKRAKALFLTYTGLLRVLFVSRNKNAETFTIWATQKLFTMQMGSKEAKEILGTEVLNIKIENYRAVFGKYTQGFPCIYLLSLGKVGALRETFGISAEINDELTVYKYGFTCDIKRRLGEHNKDYGKLKNVNVELELFNYIDFSEKTISQRLKNTHKNLQKKSAEAFAEFQFCEMYFSVFAEFCEISILRGPASVRAFEAL
jgi:predicted GIY-YIG superfamily endonuclease